MSKSEVRKRQDSTTVRLLPKEKNRMVINAKNNGFKSVPAYLRWLDSMENARRLEAARARGNN